MLATPPGFVHRVDKDSLLAGRAVASPPKRNRPERSAHFVDSKRRTAAIRRSRDASLSISETEPDRAPSPEGLEPRLTLRRTPIWRTTERPARDPPGP